MEFLVKNRKYIGLGGCAIAAIGCFLPFVSIWGINFRYSSGDGIVVIIAMIVSAILIYLKKDKFSLISSGIGVLVFLNNAIRLLSTSGVKMGIGMIMVFFGLVCAVAYPFLKEKNVTPNIMPNNQ